MRRLDVEPVDPLPAVFPFSTPDAMPAENAEALHLLLSLHTALTLAAFAAGPVMLWQAARDRAGKVFWFFTALPLVIEAQRLVVGDRCIVQDWARELWQVENERWAPDLYLVSEPYVTYVVDACIVSYAVGLVLSIGLFLRRRHGFLRGAEA